MSSAIVSRLLLLAASLFSLAAGATERAPWIHTGDGVVTTKVALVKVEVMAVSREMRCRPDHRSKADVVAADCDKRLGWRLLRDVDRETLQASLRKAYAAVDCRDRDRIARAVAAVGRDLPEGTRVNISYDASSHTTTFAVADRSVEIEGVEFMRATWRTVFANDDTKELGDALIARL